MAKSHDLQIKPQRENLPEIFAWVEAFCKTHVPAKVHENDIAMVAEELFVNAITHGGSQRNNRIMFRLLPQSEGAVLVMEAEGPPFNPLKDAPKPNVNSPLEERPIGGLGLMLVLKVTEQTEYRRVDGRNVLTLVFGPATLPPLRIDGHGLATPKATSASIAWRPRGVTLLIVAVILILMSVGLAAAAGLNYLKYKDILIDAAAARYDPEIRRVNSAIQNSLRHGLTLASIRTTQYLIDRSAAKFENVFDLAVRDIEGSVLFATDDLIRMPEKMPPQGELVHDGGDPERFIVHMSIARDGEVVGILSLSHSKEEVLEALPGMKQELQNAFVKVLIYVLPMSAIVAMVIFGQIEGQFHLRMRAAEHAGEFVSIGNPTGKSVPRIECSLQPDP